MKPDNRSETKGMKTLSVTEALIIENRNKIGIDLDLEHDPAKDLTILATYHNAKALFPDSEITIYRSASGRGYHFEIVSKEIEKLSPEEKVKIREILGDCPGRLRFSIMRGCDDVLFTMKLINGKFQSRREISKETLLGLYNERKL